MGGREAIYSFTLQSHSVLRPVTRRRFERLDIKWLILLFTGTLGSVVMGETRSPNLKSLRNHTHLGTTMPIRFHPRIPFQR